MSDIDLTNLKEAQTFVTIFTDISAIQPSQRWTPRLATYAFWAIKDGQVIEKAFGFPQEFYCGDAISTDILEMCAMCKAVEWLTKEEWIKPHNLVMLQNDNTAALGLIKGSKEKGMRTYSVSGHKLDKRYAAFARRLKPEAPVVAHKCISKLNTIEEDLPCKIILRHVRGHQKGASTRHNINHRVDKLAKGMRHRLQKLTYEERYAYEF